MKNQQKPLYRATLHIQTAEMSASCILSKMSGEMPAFVLFCKKKFVSMIVMLWCYFFVDSASITNMKPELEDLTNLLEEYTSLWDDIGRGLNVSFNYRRGLHTDASLDNDKRLERVLCSWLEKTNSSVCTWNNFIKVLHDRLSLKAAAKKVQKFLQSSEAVEKYCAANI